MLMLHTHTHTGTPFIVVVGQAGTCVVRVTAWVCVCRCVWVSLACERHLFESFLTAAARHTLKTHTPHITLTHTHINRHTHHTSHHTHTPITHRHSQPLHQLLAQTFWFVFSANSSTHTLPHTQCTEPRFTHTSKKLIKMRCADIVVRSSPSSSPFASLPSITAKNKV